jgi:hypothetical protein
MHSGAGFFYVMMFFVMMTVYCKQTILWQSLQISPFHGFRCAASMAVEMTGLSVV